MPIRRPSTLVCQRPRLGSVIATKLSLPAIAINILEVAAYIFATMAVHYGIYEAFSLWAVLMRWLDKGEFCLPTAVCFLQDPDQKFYHNADQC